MQQNNDSSHSVGFDSGPQPMASKKRNTLAWTIAVALAVIIIFACLFIVARRCRYHQNSYEYSGYRQLMNDDAEENDHGDNMGVSFHTGTVAHFNFISI